MSRKILIPIFILFLFQSCAISLSLDAWVEEHIIFKKGDSTHVPLSGTYSFMLDLTKARPLLSVLKGLEGNAEDIDALFYNSFHAAGARIAEVPGVTNVSFKHDNSFLHFTITFDFNSLKSLNEALGCIKRHKKDQRASIRFGDGRLVREFSVEEGLLQQPSSMSEEKFTRFKLFFKKIKWQTTYIFECFRVRRPTHGYKELARDRHGIVFEHFLVDMTTGCRHVIYLAK